MLNLNLTYNKICFIVIVVILIITLLIYYYYNKTANFIIVKVDSIRKQSGDYESLNKNVEYYNHSLVDKYPPNSKQFPEFYKAKFFKINLKPGMSLFIPAGWWHWVFSKNNCIALSHTVNYYTEEDIKKKQVKNYEGKTVNYCNNDSKIDFNKYSEESIPLIYSDLNGEKITTNFLERNLTKVNLLAAKTSTIVGVNKPHNTTTTIVNGTYNYFNMLNDSSYYCYIGMSPLNKKDYETYINKNWENFANKKNCENNIYLWYSKKSIDTGLHYDITDNLLSLHSGIKKILLFPPSETKYLYNELMNHKNSFTRFIIKE
jgi:hypothetical protein